jgi:hypothetical protein
VLGVVSVDGNVQLARRYEQRSLPRVNSSILASAAGNSWLQMVKRIPAAAPNENERGMRVYHRESTRPRLHALALADGDEPRTPPYVHFA